MQDRPPPGEFVAVPSPPLRTKVARAVVTVGVLLVVFVGVFPRFADYSEVVPILADLSLGEIAVLAVLALWFLSAYWLVLMTVLPTLRWREAAVNQLAGTAVSNTVPAGGAVAVGVNVSMYLSWGFTGEAIWAGLVTAGVWDGLIKAGLPVVAVSLLALASEPSVVSWAVPLLGATVLVTVSVAIILTLRSAAGAAKVGAWLARLINPIRRRFGREEVDVAARLGAFRATLVDLLKGAWRRLTLAMIANHLAMFALFVGSLRAAGVDGVSGWSMLAAFSLARLLSGVPLTPGGLGVVDAGYVALLSASAPPGGDAAIVAGVLLFRALTFFPPIPLGLAAWLFWRTNRTWRRPAGSRG